MRNSSPSFTKIFSGSVPGPRELEILNGVRGRCRLGQPGSRSPFRSLSSVFSSCFSKSTISYFRSFSKVRYRTFVFTCFVLLGHVIFDTPDGVTQERWVVPLDEKELKRIFEHLRVLCLDPSGHYLLLWHHHRHSELVASAMTHLNYRHLVTFIWHKPNKNQEGDPSWFIHNWEMCTVGLSGDFNSLPRDLPNNPLQRGTVLSAPPLT